MCFDLCVDLDLGLVPELPPRVRGLAGDLFPAVGEMSSTLILVDWLNAMSRLSMNGLPSAGL